MLFCFRVLEDHVDGNILKVDAKEKPQQTYDNV